MVRKDNSRRLLRRVNYISDPFYNLYNPSNFKFRRPIVSLSRINISTQKYNGLDCSSLRVIIVSPVIDYCRKAPDLRYVQIDVELSISVIVY